MVAIVKVQKAPRQQILNVTSCIPSDRFSFVTLACVPVFRLDV